MIYTGIGARKTPSDVLIVMESIATKMTLMNYTLRSGAADGADSAFERGCDLFQGYKEIYLPWYGFNDSRSKLVGPFTELLSKLSGEMYGPRWEYVSPAVKKLMMRNMQQILGKDISNPTYSELVICWTPDGAETAAERSKDTGGTGQAIALACALDIPVFNLKNSDAYERIQEFFDYTTVFNS